MKIVIINGAPDERYQPFTLALHTLGASLGSSHDITVFDIKDLDIHFCAGCFSCWVKTPGKCAFKDDMDAILGANATADLILYVSPIIAGTMSALTKKTLDRSIPMVLPYIENFGGECHHPRRYENRPDIGIVVMDDGHADAVSIGLLFDTFDRLAKNLHAARVIKLSAPAKTITEVIKNEISAY